MAEVDVSDLEIAEMMAQSRSPRMDTPSYELDPSFRRSDYTVLREGKRVAVEYVFSESRADLAAIYEAIPAVRAIRCVGAR